MQTTHITSAGGAGPLTVEALATFARTAERVAPPDARVVIGTNDSQMDGVTWNATVTWTTVDD